MMGIAGVIMMWPTWFICIIVVFLFQPGLKSLFQDRSLLPSTVLVEALPEQPQ